MPWLFNTISIFKSPHLIFEYVFHSYAESLLIIYNLSLNLFSFSKTILTLEQSLSPMNFNAVKFSTNICIFKFILHYYYSGLTVAQRARSAVIVLANYILSIFVCPVKQLISNIMYFSIILLLFKIQHFIASFHRKYLRSIKLVNLYPLGLEFTAPLAGILVSKD